MFKYINIIIFLVCIFNVVLDNKGIYSNLNNGKYYLFSFEDYVFCDGN